MNVDSVGVGIGVGFPDVVEEFVSGDDDALMAHEVF